MTVHHDTHVTAHKHEHGMINPTILTPVADGFFSVDLLPLHRPFAAVPADGRVDEGSLSRNLSRIRLADNRVDRLGCGFPVGRLSLCRLRIRARLQLHVPDRSFLNFAAREDSNRP